MAVGLALLAGGLLMAAVVVAPPRVVPLMVVVEGCWMEGEAEAAMEANKTRDFTTYTVPPESLPQEGKKLSPSSPPPLLPPHHPPSPHFHFHTFTLTPPSHPPPPHPLHVTPHPFFHLHTCHLHILTPNPSSLTCVCVWEPPWKDPKSAKLGC